MDKTAPHNQAEKNTRLPLSSKAIEVLQQVKKLSSQTSPCVFPGRTDSQPIKGIKTFWETIMKAANLEKSYTRDLHYAHASYLASRGVSIPVVERLSGNAQKTSMKFLSCPSDEPLRQAAELFSSLVDEASALEGI